MTKTNEIAGFAAHYGLTIEATKALWALYATKPQGYRTAIEFDSNAKTVKGQKLGYLTGIVYFAPGDISGYQVCSSASEYCLMSCLAHEGRAAIFSSIMEARIRKTLRWFRERAAFVASMLHDAFRLMRRAAKLGLKCCVRPNGTSDLPVMAHVLADAFPFLQVYDYTKHAKPWLRVKANYHLTYSYSGINWANCVDALEHGISVTVVFAKQKGKKSAVPALYKGYEVIDGDATDLRFLDKRGVIVGLTSKGKSATKETSGSFIILQ